jgi:hypothetical protein
MPRGSKPGERRGGRQRGTPNKRTLLRNAAINAAALNPDVSPLDFLLGVMRDPNVSPELRMRAAQVAAPYVHAKAGTARSSDQAPSAELIDPGVTFTIDPAIAKRLRDDKERLHELSQNAEHPKKYGGPLSAAEEQEQSVLRTRIAETQNGLQCPAGYGAIQARKDYWRLDDLIYKRRTPRQTLTEAEDAEEAQLTARTAAFEQTPEGRARHRIRELKCRMYLSTAEQSELDSLRTLYPNLPPDPDDPLTSIFERSASLRPAKPLQRTS